MRIRIHRRFPELFGSLFMNVDRYEGVLLGLALGDASGAPYEGGPAERLAWWLLGRTSRGERRWTDDTQMSVDLAESLLACGRLNQDDLARRFAASYRWSRGYGSGAGKLLKRIRQGADWRVANRSVFRDGSYGNGAAMRAPVLSLFVGAHVDRLPALVEQASEITHAHRLAIQGAQMIAAATSAALTDNEPDAIFDAAVKTADDPSWADRFESARMLLASQDEFSPSRVRKELGNRISARESCVTAVAVAVHFLQKPWHELMEFVIRLGGDVDTIAAMASAIWGGARGAGALPRSDLNRLEARERIQSLARHLWEIHQPANETTAVSNEAME
jgi:poly(ADP-ribose) glycohydrolase ARH3